MLAEDLYPKRIPGDEPEPIEVVPWRVDDFTSLVEQEDFLEARSIAALYLLQHYMDKKCSPKKTL